MAKEDDVLNHMKRLRKRKEPTEDDQVPPETDKPAEELEELDLGELDDPGEATPSSEGKTTNLPARQTPSKVAPIGQRRRGRPRKGEEVVVEAEVPFTTSIPESLSLAIDEYLESPLGKVRTKKALVTYAVKRFLNETAAIRKKINRTLDKELGDL